MVVVLEALSSTQIVMSNRQWQAWVLQQLLLLPLLARRRYPEPVFAVIASVYLVQWLSGDRLVADFGLLIALYTVAAKRGWRRAIPAAGAVEVLAVLTSFHNSPDHNGALGSLVFLTGLAAAALFTGTTVRTRGDYLEALEDRARRLEKERDQQAQLAATAERSRIAREMHDIVAHSLSVMIALADGAAAADPTDPDAARQAMLQSASTGRTALGEMRRLLGVLRQDAPADYEPQPTLANIDSLLDRVRTAGIAVDYRVTGDAPMLAETTNTNIYRIIQESLTNVLKHADRPSRVTVSVIWNHQDVTIIVTDDGCSDPRPESDGGHGLAGIRERVHLYGGRLRAGPRPQGGWSVEALLRLDHVAP